MNLLPAAPLPAPSDRYLAEAGRRSVHTARAARDSLQVLAGLALPDHARAVQGAKKAGLPVELDLSRVPWHALTVEDVDAFRKALAERYAPASMQRHLSSLRRVLRVCAELGLLDYGQLAQLLKAADLRVPEAPPRRAVADDDVRRTLRSAVRDKNSRGVRDAALLAVLLGAGLRRSEAAALDLANVDPESGRIALTGKGGKARVVFLPPSDLPLLRAWLTLRGDAPGALFLGLRRGGKLNGQRLTPQAVRNVVHDRSGSRLRPHDLRAWAITDTITAGEAEDGRRFAGHSSSRVTARYDLAAERRARWVAEQRRLPR